MCFYFTANCNVLVCGLWKKEQILNNIEQDNLCTVRIYVFPVFLNFCTSQDKKEISNNKIHITFDANDRLIQNLKYDLFYFSSGTKHQSSMLYSLIPHHPYIGACSLLTFKFLTTFALPRKIFFLPYFIF